MSTANESTVEMEMENIENVPEKGAQLIPNGQERMEEPLSQAIEADPNPKGDNQAPQVGNEEEPVIAPIEEGRLEEAVAAFEEGIQERAAVVVAAIPNTRKRRLEKSALNEEELADDDGDFVPPARNTRSRRYVPDEAGRAAEDKVVPPAATHNAPTRRNRPAPVEEDDEALEVVAAPAPLRSCLARRQQPEGERRTVRIGGAEDQEEVEMINPRHLRRNAAAGADQEGEREENGEQQRGGFPRIQGPNRGRENGNEPEARDPRKMLVTREHIEMLRAERVRVQVSYGGMMAHGGRYRAEAAAAAAAAAERAAAAAERVAEEERAAEAPAPPVERNRRGRAASQAPRNQGASGSTTRSRSKSVARRD